MGKNAQSRANLHYVNVINVITRSKRFFIYINKRENKTLLCRKGGTEIKNNPYMTPKLVICMVREKVSSRCKYTGYCEGNS